MDAPKPTYIWEEHRKILTAAETGIPALALFGISSCNCARQPLHRHYHPDCLELVFLIKGVQLYEVQGVHFTVTGMNVFTTQPGEPHSSGSDPESICDMIWLQIDLRKELPFFGLDAHSAQQLRGELRALPRLFSADPAMQQGLLSAFYKLAAPDPALRFYGRQLLVCMLSRLVLCARRPQQENTAGTVDSAVDYICENIGSEIRLEDAAALCGLSLSRFHVLFRQAMGTTPREYINRCRVERAKKHLEQGAAITDTALDLGFGTPNYFAVLFKKYTGMTPTQYRAQAKKAAQKK